jgi:hypothetical protein
MLMIQTVAALPYCIALSYLYRKTAGAGILLSKASVLADN